MALEFGILGALLILGAWVFETFESVKRHRAAVDLKFAVVYMFGNISLIIYSWFTSDMVFLFINVGIFCIVIFEIAYTLWLLKRR